MAIPDLLKTLTRRHGTFQEPTLTLTARKIGR